MSNLQKIVVLCVVLVIPLAYYVGTQNTPTDDITKPNETNAQIDPPSLELDTGPGDISTEPETVNVSNVINLSGQGLTTVPEYVFSQKQTQELNLSNNSLRGALQAEVRHLQNLRILNLSNNNFTGMPAEVGQLTQLEILNLSGNPLTGLPYELGNLKNLKVLDVRNTNYSQQDLNILSENLPKTTTILK